MTSTMFWLIWHCSFLIAFGVGYVSLVLSLKTRSATLFTLQLGSCVMTLECRTQDVEDDLVDILLSKFALQLGSFGCDAGMQNT